MNLPKDREPSGGILKASVGLARRAGGAIVRLLTQPQPPAGQEEPRRPAEGTPPAAAPARAPEPKPARLVTFKVPPPEKYAGTRHATNKDLPNQPSNAPFGLGWYWVLNMLGRGRKENEDGVFSNLDRNVFGVVDARSAAGGGRDATQAFITELQHCFGHVNSGKMKTEDVLANVMEKSPRRFVEKNVPRGGGVTYALVEFPKEGDMNVYSQGDVRVGVFTPVVSERNRETYQAAEDLRLVTEAGGPDDFVGPYHAGTIHKIKGFKLLPGQVVMVYSGAAGDRQSLNRMANVVTAALHPGQTPDNRDVKDVGTSVRLIGGDILEAMEKQKLPDDFGLVVIHYSGPKKPA